MTRIVCFTRRLSFCGAVLALLAVTTEAQAHTIHSAPHFSYSIRIAHAKHASHSASRPTAHPTARPVDLSKATRLVAQSRRIVSHAHKHDPRGYGGHEARAAVLLKRAALELNEASDYQTFNARSAAHQAHAATRRPRTKAS